MAKTSMNFGCKIVQFPVNLNDATTGHKLQGMSKDVVIVTNWPTSAVFENWEYVVLSRVRKLEGLFLIKPIDMDKSFEPSDDLKPFFKRARER